MSVRENEKRDGFTEPRGAEKAPGQLRGVDVTGADLKTGRASQRLAAGSQADYFLVALASGDSRGSVKSSRTERTT